MKPVGFLQENKPGFSSETWSTVYAKTPWCEVNLKIDKEGTMTVSELIFMLQKFDQHMQVKTCSPILWGGTQLHSLEPADVGVVGSVEFDDGEWMEDESRFYLDGKEYRLKYAVDRGEPVFVLRLK